MHGVYSHINVSAIYAKEARENVNYEVGLFSLQ